MYLSSLNTQEECCLNESKMSMLSVKSEKLCSIIEEVRSIVEDVDAIDLSYFDKFIDTNNKARKLIKEKTL